MAYEVTALMTFWVDATSEVAARETIENLEGEEVADKVEASAIQVNRVDAVKHQGAAT